MRDIFISPLTQPLPNWTLGGDQPAHLCASLAEVVINSAAPALFWLHISSQDDAWITAVIAQIGTQFPAAKVIVLANVPTQAQALSAMRCGAQGYCHAYSDTSVLAEVKAVVSHGGVWLGQDLLQHLIGISLQLLTTKAEAVQSALNLLTPREQEVAKLAAQGLSNKLIARQLEITERTVKAHLSSSFERLGIKDRLRLALMLNQVPASHADDGAEYAAAGYTTPHSKASRK